MSFTTKTITPHFKIGKPWQSAFQCEHPNLSSIRPRHAFFFCRGLGLYLADVTDPFFPPRTLPHKRPTKTLNAWFQNKRASDKKRKEKETEYLHASLQSQPGQIGRHQSSAAAGQELSNGAAAPTPPSSQTDSPYGISPRPLEDDIAGDEAEHPVYAGHHHHHQHHNPHNRNNLRSAPPSVGTPDHPRHLPEILPDPSPATPNSIPLKRRLRPSGTQSQQLKDFFNENPHPTKEERQELGESLGM